MITNYENFKQSINNSIQNSGLDVGAIYYVLKDFINIVEKLYYAQLNSEALNKVAEKENNTSNSKQEECKND